jgi:hypothetical protein
MEFTRVELYTLINMRPVDRRLWLSGADLSGADLSKADLSGANLNEAILNEAELRWTRLRGAGLTGADLSEANLTGAKMTAEQLAQARTVQGATMPDGAEYPGKIRSSVRRAKARAAPTEAEVGATEGQPEQRGEIETGGIGDHA